MEKIRIGLIDDHRALTDAMASLINQKDGYTAHRIAHNYEDALNEITQDDCKIYVIDMNLGKGNSCDLVHQVTQNGKIAIVLSAYSDVSLIKRAVKAGAKAYLSKSSAASNIFEAMESTLKGKTYYDNIIQSSINRLIGDHSRISTARERVPFDELTDREKDIIRLIALEYTSEEIAQELHLSKNTVDGYRKNLISKLGVRNSVGLVRINDAFKRNQ